ncbi:dipeptide ABC transporter ATP-binding protein [Microbacterium sp. YY-03]|uniref:dipeptide ABC transporter ATP-binding protein n=1 Tax=Microbacterium sp. YY-03 TaxID=3421636 RepID=UPI003D170A29
MTLLDISDLVVSYRAGRARREAIHGVSLSIAEGEAIALVGESGSGKTTTAQAVLGLLPDGARIDSGTIELGRQEISGWSQRRLATVRGAHIGLIPQDPVSSLDPVRTIGVQVGEIFRLHGERDRATIRKNVLELLERVGIDDPVRRAAQYPHQLSGGMRQRVLIATAVALRPRLLIADEPTSALDATVARRILDLIDELRAEQGTSVLLVTHDLAVAASRADHLVVLNGGRVVESGDARKILQNPQDAYTRQLLADAPALAAEGFRRIPVPLYLREASVVAAEKVNAIEVSGLVKSYQTRGASDFRAVDDVSFTVRRGTTHALVGESGSGKTTTARIIAGFATPDSGTVTVADRDVTSLAGRDLRNYRRTLQLVYQNPFSSLDPRQKIGAIVAEPLQNFGRGTRAERTKRVAELIDRVSLPQAVLTRTAAELSGGQRQRIAIARALAAHPEVVVLDEAVSALDVTVQARILELLVGLQHELGLTYLFISHDLAVVRSLSHTVSVMQRGRVVESGTTEAIFTQPTHDYTKELLGAVPSRSEVLA